MKNIAIIMTLIFSLGFSSSLLAQDEKMSKEEKKNAKKEKIAQQYKITKDILESKEFVLEANYLGNKYGERIPVSSNLNFIFVDSTEATFQIGNYHGVGYNGVGGITTDGPVTDWELETDDKKKSFYLKMNVMTSLGVYDVFMNVSSDGYATATLSGLSSGKLVYTGNIVPTEESFVYEGFTTY